MEQSFKLSIDSDAKKIPLQKEKKNYKLIQT